MQTPKILIVEDEEVMLRSLVEKFTNNSFIVVPAKDGEEGLKMAQSEKPDLILLDNLMPKMDGMIMMAKIREADDWGKNVPIIILTNFDTNDQIIDSVSKYTPAYYLVKTNFSLDQVVDKVKEVLAGGVAA